MQAAFLQVCALPERAVRLIASSELPAPLVRGLSQWRVDFPAVPKGILDADARNVLAVAEQILTQGQRLSAWPSWMTFWPVSSHRTRRLSKERWSQQKHPAVSFHASWFDSPAEESFCRDIMQESRAAASGWRIVPQVALSPLSPKIDPASDARADFGLFHTSQPPLVVEIDGAQHAEHTDRDGVRDQCLQAAGITTIRVRASATGALRQDPEGRRLLDLLRSGPASEPPLDLSGVRLCQWTTQLQLIALRALSHGWLKPDRAWRLGVMVPDHLRNVSAARRIAHLAIQTLRSMLVRLSRLLGSGGFDGEVVVVGRSGAANEPSCDVAILPGDDATATAELTQHPAVFFHSSTLAPVGFMAPLAPCSPTASDDPSEDDAKWFLRYIFRKVEFREGQWDVVRRTLQGKDSIVLLPTGAGKSIAFQLSSLLLPGRGIVVGPLISLIEDQVDNLRWYGIDRAVGISSNLRHDQRSTSLDLLSAGHFLLSYVSPERFQSIGFRQTLRTLTAAAPVSLVAIDEAHCVSEWGHDFRTAYLNLGRNAREYRESSSQTPPLVALTGTASRIVLKDVQRELDITDFDAIITPRSFDRPELNFTVLRCQSDQKPQRVAGFLQGVPALLGADASQAFRPSGSNTNCGLVFCPHVNGPYGVHEYKNFLEQRFQVRVGTYSGSGSAQAQGAMTATDRLVVAREFKSDRFSVMACTKAFGMGIDKANIRFTVHIALPQSIEAFYQEAGRAGRDRRPAFCALIVSNDDPARATRLLANDTPLTELARASSERANGDDITRALWFHSNAFQGIGAETEDVETLLAQLGDLGQTGERTVSWEARIWHRRAVTDRKQAAEKALHRLVVLGVASDYTIDWSAKELTIRLSGASRDTIIDAYSRYVSRYSMSLAPGEAHRLASAPDSTLAQFVVRAARLLIEFIYSHVEQARRQSLNTMLLAASVSRSGDDLRRRVLEYLQQSEWDDRLEPLRAGGWPTDVALAELFDMVASPNDAASLRGATDRMLASYPDVPALLLVRSLAEALCRDTDLDVVVTHARSAVSAAFDRYHVDEVTAAATISWAGRFLMNDQTRWSVATDFIRGQRNRAGAAESSCVPWSTPRLAISSPGRPPCSTHYLFGD